MIAVATVVSICASFYLFALTQIKFLKANWPKYRCNPIYMPMAGLVGQDVTANFTKCTMKGFQDYAGFVMDPIMSQFSLFNSVIGDISSSMNDMRGMMSDVRGGFLGIVGTVFGKIENLMSQFQYIIIRMRTLLARTVGIMMSFMYIFYGGMQTGESVTNGPIGKTISVLCFDQSTEITMNDGTKNLMKNLKLGDMLPNNNKVISLYTIDGAGVQMYMLGGVKVSGTHKVMYKNSYISASTHPNAVETTGSASLTCINTEQGSFKISNYTFMNFTEIGTPQGISGKVLISMKSGPVPIPTVKVGDIIDNDCKIIGTVKHLVDGNTVYNLITANSFFPTINTKGMIIIVPDEIRQPNKKSIYKTVECF